MPDKTQSADAMTADARIQEIAQILSVVVKREYFVPPNPMQESKDLPTHL
jgi:hypothetical protein